MKRFFSFLVVIMVLTTAVVAFADGNGYQQTEPYAQEYYVLANETKVYRDETCRSVIGTLNFGDKVYLQAEFDQIAYVMFGSVTNGAFGYVEKGKLGQPMRKVRLTGHVYLSPARDERYDDASTYGAAMGGDRVKEDAFVLCELNDHILLLTDEGCMGWASKYDTGIQEIESYRAVNTLDTDYYWFNYKPSNDVTYYYYYRTLRPKLSLYKNASTKGGASKKLSFGTQVEVQDTKGEWALVVDDTGASGWLKKAYIGNAVMRVRIRGEVKLNPLPGMQDTDFATASGGIASNTEALVVEVVGDYYLLVTSTGACGFVYGNNVEIIQTYDSYNYGYNDGYYDGYYGDYDYDWKNYDGDG